MNEVIGSTVLAMLIFTLAYFIFASKIKLGFDTTLLLALPIVLIFGLTIAGFTVIFAFAAVVIGALLGFLFMRILERR